MTQESHIKRDETHLKQETKVQTYNQNTPTNQHKNFPQAPPSIADEDEDEYEEIDEYVLLDILDQNIRIDPLHVNISFMDLETSHPLVQIDSQVYDAYWTPSDGTSLIFAAPGLRNTESAMDDELLQPSLICKTFTHLRIAPNASSQQRKRIGSRKDEKPRESAEK